MPPAATIEDLIIVDDESGYYGFYLAGEKIVMTESLDHKLWEALEVPVRAIVLDSLGDCEDFPQRLSDLMLQDPQKPHLNGTLARLGANEEQMRRYHQISCEFDCGTDIDEFEIGSDGTITVGVFDRPAGKWMPVALHRDGSVVPDVISA